MRNLVVFLLPLIFFTHTRACLSAFQYKIFPVGMRHDSLYTIDYRLYRLSTYQGNDLLKLGLKSASPSNAMWQLKASLSIYDVHQRLVYSKPIDSTYNVGLTYGDTLKQSFLRALKILEAQFLNLEKFEPQSISFCNYQQQCWHVSVGLDSLSQQSILKYQGRSFKITVLSDTNYYPIRFRGYSPIAINDLYINSVRIFKTKRSTLVIGFLTMGDEIDSGLITHDPKKAGMTEDGEVAYLKEYRPVIPFGKSIRSTTYTEPILHHGFGMDLFVVTPN